MATRNLNYYLIKTARASGWLLFLLVLLYILTGFSLTGELELVGEQIALIVHKESRWPLIVVFLVHSLTTIYFAFRRWGWIKKGTRA